MAGAELDLAALRELLRAVLPLWGQNIELAQGQTAQAADGLNARFISMSQQVSQVLEHGAVGEGGGVFEVLATGFSK